MTENEIPQVETAPEAPPAPQYAPQAVQQVGPVVRNPVRAWLITLTVIVGIQLLLTIALIAVSAVGYFGFIGMPMDGDYMQAETVAMDVGYYVSSQDVDGYMKLYPEDDPHVDRAAVREDFERVAESFVATETSVDFTPDSIIVYEDEATDEKLAWITISAYDYDTGRPVGKRLKFWAVLGDDGVTVLTGNKDRALSDGESVW